MEEFKSLVEDYKNIADFVTVYISEAHPLDGWATPGNEFSIHSHMTLDDRLFAANVLAEKKLPCPIIVDQMSNDAALAYGAHPERLYIIKDNIIEYAGKMGPFYYDPKEVSAWLDKNVKKSY